MSDASSTRVILPPSTAGAQSRPEDFSGLSQGAGGEATEVVYFGPDLHRMFGVLQRPSGRARAGIVLCPPYGEEMVASYTHFTRWAKKLAQEGFVVFRYHPYGTGESEGDPGDFTLESAKSGAVEAVSYLKTRIHLDRLGLFGLRFGGFVAVQAATVCRPDFLVLWSPVVQPKQYCRDLLRMLLTTELVHQQTERVRVTTRTLVEELEAGRPVDIMGYDMSPEFYRQMTANPAFPEAPPASDVLWLTRPREGSPATSVVEKWKANGKNVELQSLDGPAFWEDWEFGFPENFARATSSWLAQNKFLEPWGS